MERTLRHTEDSDFTAGFGHDEDMIDVDLPPEEDTASVNFPLPYLNLHLDLITDCAGRYLMPSFHLNHQRHMILICRLIGVSCFLFRRSMLYPMRQSRDPFGIYYL